MLLGTTITRLLSLRREKQGGRYHPGQELETFIVYFVSYTIIYEIINLIL